MNSKLSSVIEVRIMSNSIRHPSLSTSILTCAIKSTKRGFLAGKFYKL